MLMHAGISLRSYPRSDTKLSRPHPDTTNSSTGLGCEDIQNRFLTYSNSNIIYFENLLKFKTLFKNY